MFPLELPSEHTLENIGLKIKAVWRYEALMDFVELGSQESAQGK